ncbi:beta-ketoacyl synthase N-terminal-like domain-containing protein [Actinomadura terrae]|uniref:beta-ketoacyl synthase N-terminal-like domain-containing protein n=1 Tax=Actinomadura terrae TaxID=604353 RepID=UPI001FA79DF9|nr:beta-ketoacyl synthase N-terminal-like domain-containing protein [Actinomadura terrae]
MDDAVRPVVTAWSAFSPFGMGREAFAAGVAEGRSAVAGIDRERWGTPDDRAGLVPGFEIRRVLGGKGVRGMDRLAGLAVATVRGLHEERPGDEATALVLGTTTGGAQTMMDITRTALTAPLPYRIDAAAIPYGVMNGAAGQCAIRHGYRGPNATIASGRPTGLAALNYARRLLLTGRARNVVCGAVEEYSRARSWLEFHSRDGDAAGTVPGEGCAMFAVGLPPRDGTPVLAEVLALDFRVCVDGDWDAALDRSVREVAADPADVWATCASGAAGPAGRAELAALEQAAPAATRLAPVAELIGETGAASAAFQLAAVLALAERSPDAAGRTAVITSADPSCGMVAAALLRI